VAYFNFLLLLNCKFLVFRQPQGSKKKYAPFGPLKGYLEGIVYGNLAGLYPKGALLIARVDKDRYTEMHFENLDAVYGRISKRLILDTNKATEKLKKKIK